MEEEEERPGTMEEGALEQDGRAGEEREAGDDIQRR
jgi:hypothetical protein